MRPRTTLALALAVAAATLCGSLGASGLWSGPERLLVDAALRGDAAPGALAACAGWLVRAGVGVLGPSDAAARAGFAALALASTLALALAAHRTLGRATGAWVALAYATLPLAFATARNATTSALAQSVFTALFACAVALRGGGASRGVARHCCRAGMLALAWAASSGGAPTHVAASLESLGHALFPWTGLALVAVCALADADADAPERAVRVETFVTLGALFVATVLRGVGAAPLLAGPLALALALLLDRGRLDRAGAWIVVLVTAVHARDLWLYPRPFLGDAAAVVGAAGEGARVTIAALLAGDAPPGVYALAALAGCAPVLALGLLDARLARAAVAVAAVFAALCFSRGAERAWGHARSSSAAWQALHAQAASRDPVALLARSDEAPPTLHAPATLRRWRDGDAAASWLLAGGRRWLVVDRASLASLNHAHRAATGRNATVAGGRAEGWMLATSAATASLNPLDAVVSSGPSRVPEGARYEAFGEAPRFGDEVALEGVDVRVRGGGALRPGASVELGSHLRVLRAVGEDRQVFVHVDGPCARVNVDHAPADGLYPTSLWRAGDRVRDAFTVTIPWYCPRGRYAVWAGFFAGDARVRVTRGPHDGADRVLAATLDAR